MGAGDEAAAYAWGVQARRRTSNTSAGRRAQVLRSIDDLTDEQAAEPPASRAGRAPRSSPTSPATPTGSAAWSRPRPGARSGRCTRAPISGPTESRRAGVTSPAVLRADLRGAHDRLVDAWNDLPDDAWDRLGRASAMRTMREFVWVRRREVEVHHVDLDLGYEASDWPVSFVAAALDEIFDTFAGAGRVDAAARRHRLPRRHHRSRPRLADRDARRRR